MSDLALFDAAPYLVPAAEVEPGKQLSTGRRLTLRQAADLARGRHPLTRGPLHPDAAPADDRRAGGLRCGTCRFRVVSGHHNRTYAKCHWPDETEYLAVNLPRVTHGPATDVRAYWPACRDYQPDPGLPRPVVTATVSEVLR